MEDILMGVLLLSALGTTGVAGIAIGAVLMLRKRKDT